MKDLTFVFIALCLLIPSYSLNAELKQKDIQEAYYNSYRYEKTGNYTDAIKALKLVHNHYPKGYTVNFRIAHLYFMNQKYSNAVSHYNLAIQSSKYAISPKLGLMLVQINQGQYGKAEETGYQILSSDYYNYYGNLRLIYALRMQKNHKLAEKVCLKMLAVYPSDTAYLVKYGILKFIAKQYPGAKKVFSSVLILDPENVTAKEYLLTMGAL